MRLNALLDAWSGWLTLFPPAHAAALGDLLLRLSPLFEPLRRQAGPQALEPAGIGDIVARGSYERLLTSEWALLDAAPDEFLRRAANGELLFTGPEPMHSEESLRSIALFDAGPSQLGEARLVHMAMLILLARRAELAGAQFQWGVLQQPGLLHDELGAKGVRLLLDARTLEAADAAAIEAWDAALADASDCWVIGDPDAARPHAARAQVALRRSWLDAGLEVTLTQRGRSRTLALPLPAPADCVRLLRAPFEPPSKAAVTRHGSNAHSLKRPPMFSGYGGWLAAGMVDGSVTVYNLPASLRAAPGRPRNGGKLPHVDAIVAAGAFDNAFGALAMADGALHPFGFPGRFFNKIGKATLPLPARDEFEAVPGALRWAQAFFLRRETGSVFTEYLLVLDKTGRLVCWTRSSQKRGLPPVTTEFRVIAKHVIGAVQHGQRLLFAVGIPGRTDAYILPAGHDKPGHLLSVTQDGQRFLFGRLHDWTASNGMYALQTSDTEWRVGEGLHAARIKVDADHAVLGCARRIDGEAPGLVVLEQSRTRIALYLTQQRITLVETTEPIAQAAFDPLKNRLAWLGRNSTMLTVRGLADAQPLLQTIPQGDAGANTARDNDRYDDAS